MSSEKVKATYNLDKKIVDTIQAMSNYTKKPVENLVETALKFFIATHNDYLGYSLQDHDDPPTQKSGG